MAFLSKIDPVIVRLEIFLLEVGSPHAQVFGNAANIILDKLRRNCLAAIGTVSAINNGKHLVVQTVGQPIHNSVVFHLQAVDKFKSCGQHAARRLFSNHQQWFACP
jgi:hypothetical protein